MCGPRPSRFRVHSRDSAVQGVRGSGEEDLFMQWFMCLRVQRRQSLPMQQHAGQSRRAACSPTCVAARSHFPRTVLRPAARHQSLLSWWLAKHANAGHGAGRVLITSTMAPVRSTFGVE